MCSHEQTDEECSSGLLSPVILTHFLYEVMTQEGGELNFLRHSSVLTLATLTFSHFAPY